MIAERLIEQITRMPRVLLLEPTAAVAVPLKQTIEQNFKCAVDWQRDDDQVNYEHLDYDIIFVDAEMAMLHNILDHLHEQAPYTPVVLIGEARQPFKGIVTIFPENKNDLAVLDEVFGKFKLRVKRHRPVASDRSAPTLFS